MRMFNDMMGEMNIASFTNKIYTDFKFFYEQVLGFTELGGLNQYKKEWFNLAYENDRVMIKAPSGFAKTTVLGVAFPIWVALTNPGTKILLISKTLTQSKDALLIQIRDLIEDNEFLRKALMPEERDKIWNQTQLRLSNGVTIVNRPYSINIRGYRANIIILDEIDSYDDPGIYFDYVVPRLIPGGKIIGISTPEEGTSTLMELILLRDRGSNEYIFKTYVSIVNAKDPKDLSTGESIWPEMFSIDELMRRRNELGEQKWQKNYMCDAMTEGEDSIFKATTIESCKNYQLKFTVQNYEEEMYIGCDFAVSSSPTGDYDAFVAIGKKKDVGTIKFGERWKGTEVPEKVKRIEELYYRYKAVMIICDNSGIGSEVIRLLRLKGLPVDSQSFHSGERNILLNNLLALMSNKKIVIPKHQDDLQAIDFANILEYELFSFREIKSAAGHTSYVSKGTHDDTVMGLAMAVKYISLLQEFEDYIGVSNGEYPKENVEPQNIPNKNLDPNVSFSTGIPIR